MKFEALIITAVIGLAVGTIFSGMIFESRVSAVSARIEAEKIGEVAKYKIALCVSAPENVLCQE